MAGVYYLLNDLVAFDRIMHLKWPRERKHKSTSVEDLGMLLLRLIMLGWRGVLKFVIQLSLSIGFLGNTIRLSKGLLPG